MQILSFFLGLSLLLSTAITFIKEFKSSDCLTQSYLQISHNLKEKLIVRQKSFQTKLHCSKIKSYSRNFHRIQAKNNFSQKVFLKLRDRIDETK